MHEPEGGASTSAPAAGEQATAGADDFIRRWRTRAEAQLLALDMVRRRWAKCCGCRLPAAHPGWACSLHPACLLHAQCACAPIPRPFLPVCAPPLQDGTLLDSRSRVLPSSVAAIKAALARGVTVFLATGKARPAAIKAMEAVGLAGEGLVVSSTGPGIFLQGGCGVWCTSCARGAARLARVELVLHATRLHLTSLALPRLRRADGVRPRRAADCGRPAAHGRGARRL